MDDNIDIGSQDNMISFFEGLADAYWTRLLQN